MLRGATPVFVDIRPDTLNLDESQLEALDHPEDARDRAGALRAASAARWTRSSTSPSDHGIPVVEDNAHGLFGSYRGQALGTFGSMAAQSFHETKNFSCGEGGALVINDPAYVERAEIIREKGTNRRNFFRGLVDKYTWVDIGSSYLPSDLLAAMLLAQLEDREWVWEHRSTRLESLRRRARRLVANQQRGNAVCPGALSDALPSLPHDHAVRAVTGRADRHLRAEGILAVFHYQPLHLSPYGSAYNRPRTAR